MGLIRIGTNDIHYMVTECVRHLLNEDQAAKSISAAIRLVMDKCGYCYKDAEHYVRKFLRSAVPVLRTKKGAKFILGVTRWSLGLYFNNNNASAVIKAIINGHHEDEFDRNLNGISLGNLLWMFKDDIKDRVNADKSELDLLKYGENAGYQIVRIDSFEDSVKYAQYTDWCITHDDSMFYTYTNDEINQFYFLLKEGFENVKKITGENAPLDEYGLSMLAICVDEEGELLSCTSRWNHNNGGSENVLNTREISQLIGKNFYSVFKPNNNWKETLSNVYSKLKSGAKLSDIFTYVGDDSWNGIRLVGINERYNYITSDRKFLSDEWFDSAYEFKDGFGIIRCKYGFNFIDANGNFLLNHWYDYVDFFENGFAKVSESGKENFIDKNGNVLCDEWFDECWCFRHGCAHVMDYNRGTNLIDKNGNILLSEWVYSIFDIRCGLMRVRRYKKDCKNNFNYVDAKGNIRFKTWFSNAFDFDEINCCAYVEFEKDGNLYSCFIDTSGNIKSSSGNYIHGKIE